MKVLVVQLCLTLCNPMDCSLPDCSAHGILQARILEWVAIPFSRHLPDPRIKPGFPILYADSLWSEPPGNLYVCLVAQSCPTLCNPMGCSPSGSSVHGIFQAKILEQFAIAFSNACMHAKLLQSCPTLRPHRRQPSRLCPQDSPGKNTGAACHFLLQRRHKHSLMLVIINLSRVLNQSFHPSYMLLRNSFSKLQGVAFV